MPETLDTIVLIHGLWMTPRSWENWAERYESRGYKVLAPAWPGMEGEVEALNEDPSPIAALDIEEIVDNYESIIRGLDSPPIIMGHSLGGTVTQLLLDRGIGAAGVGVASGTVKGVLDLPFSTLKSSSPVLRNPFNKGKAIPLDKKQFHYAFGNTLSQEESDAIYERYHVPAAATVLFEVAFANLHLHAPTKVNFDNDERAPLLFIAFEEDHIVPPKASRHNAEKYEDSKAITEFKEFPGRPHFPAAPGWEEVADYALTWATEKAAAEPSWARRRPSSLGARPKTRGAGMVVCSHLDQLRVTTLPASIAGCEECLTMGSSWVHLRMCMTCGKIGCCDSSPNRHASRHAREAAHPIARSAEPGDDWSWCFVDEVAFFIEPSAQLRDADEGVTP